MGRAVLIVVAAAAVFSAGVVVGSSSPRSRPAPPPGPVVVPEVLSIREPVGDGEHRVTNLRVLQVRHPGASPSDPVSWVGERPARAWVVRVDNVNYLAVEK